MGKQIPYMIDRVKHFHYLGETEETDFADILSREGKRLAYKARPGSRNSLDVRIAGRVDGFDC